MDEGLFSDLEYKGSFESYSGGNSMLPDNKNLIMYAAIGAIILIIFYFMYTKKDSYANLDETLLRASGLRRLGGDQKENLSMKEAPGLVGITSASTDPASDYHCPCARETWNKCAPLDTWMGPSATCRTDPPKLSESVFSATESFSRTRGSLVMGEVNDNDLTMIAAGH